MINGDSKAIHSLGIRGRFLHNTHAENNAKMNIAVRNRLFVETLVRLVEFDMHGPSIDDKRPIQNIMTYDTIALLWCKPFLQSVDQSRFAAALRTFHKDVDSTGAVLQTQI